MTVTQWRRRYWSGGWTPRWTLFDCKMFAGEGAFGGSRSCFAYSEM